MSINMCQHPAYQVNVSRKEVLCAQDSSKFFGTPCIVFLHFYNLRSVLSCFQTEGEISVLKFKAMYHLNQIKGRPFYFSQ